MECHALSAGKRWFVDRHKALVRSDISALEEYTKAWNTSFEFNFVSEKNLTKKELEVFRKTDAILKLIGEGRDASRRSESPKQCG